MAILYCIESYTVVMYNLNSIIMLNTVLLPYAVLISISLGHGI